MPSPADDGHRGVPEEVVTGLGGQDREGSSHVGRGIASSGTRGRAA